MEGLSLFNIGFRCENICLALNEYIKTKNINQFVLNDSEKIISDCFSVTPTSREGLSFSKYDLTDLYGLIFQLFKSKTVPEMLTVLKNVSSVIDQLKAGKKI